ncbi:hypothetical protein A1O3_09302 [Capronia epimyces CBS 606.96]|uniref:Uncharacterized protein n=1 Tax=Capronia epimyces CBS 606.96 TaxID=1182542 RepID=W9XMD1_9EURO|nr:uncharacterized protein A1O3_09302 [Capronia epimyces CBS 606.96]EXJ78141.1 hypothetical protein A1O3_09302 [Capronia epimyces CBS 606.96]
MSPSQPLRLDKLTPRPQPHESAGSPGRAFVDLTTPEHPRQGFEQSQLHPPVSLYLPQSAHQPAAVIKQLADNVCGPNPKGGQSRFTTHLTKTLEKVSTRVPLSKYFRPAHVARDVGVLERGYWQFFVRIGDRKYRQLSGRQMISPLWTEKDFDQFWQGISKFIQQGKAGWGTRLVKESRGGNEWRIRLFTWAELLGPIWVILWILSNKLTQGVSMQWIAGDGSVVVQMAGGQSRRRRSRVWMRRGPKGEGGAWGWGLQGLIKNT